MRKQLSRYATTVVVADQRQRTPERVARFDWYIDACAFMRAVLTDRDVRVWVDGVEMTMDNTGALVVGASVRVTA